MLFRFLEKSNTLGIKLMLAYNQGFDNSEHPFYTIVNSDLLFTFLVVLSLNYLSLQHSFSN